METYNVRRVVNADGTTEHCRITVGDGIIQSITPGSHADTPKYQLAVPGFIDMHTHGGAGYDIMDTDVSRFSRIASFHVTNGTTSYIGSTTTSPVEELVRVLSDARTAVSWPPAATDPPAVEASLLGIHVEGPWISPERAGAQNPAYMNAPDEAALSFVRTYHDIIRMVTFSYHYPEAEDLLGALLELGIIPACGHDQTVDDRIVQGFRRGLRHITHIYSMSSSFQRVGGYKHLGTLEMALMTPGVTVEVIADGKHITEYFWRFIRHNKPVEDIVIVSDSMRWAGMQEDGDRVHKLGDVDVIVHDGVAWLADRSAFAGSVATMHSMFVRLVQEWGVDLQSAVRMTSANQAAELGVSETVGSIEAGKIADFVLLDDNLEIVQVVKSGIPVR